MKQKSLILILLMATVAAAAGAQTAPKAAAPAANAKTATTTQKSTASTTGVKLPPGVPPARGIVKTAFALRYQDIKIGTGAEAAYIKTETVHYTGWLAADGHKFDSSYDRRNPVMGKDGKPEMGDDGKPKLGDPHPEPFTFIEGNPRLISGWNLGIDGMKVGGKRRIFVPWQMAYGAQGRPPAIPSKADLIFDVELLDVKDTQMPPSRPTSAMPPNVHPLPGGAAPRPGTPGSTVVPPPTGAPAATPTPPAPVTSPAPATPPQPQ